MLLEICLNALATPAIDASLHPAWILNGKSARLSRCGTKRGIQIEVWWTIMLEMDDGEGFNIRSQEMSEFF
jgi:hypothetical protein